MVSKEKKESPRSLFRGFYSKEEKWNDDKVNGGSGLNAAAEMMMMITMLVWMGHW